MCRHDPECVGYVQCQGSAGISQTASAGAPSLSHLFHGHIFPKDTFFPALVLVSKKVFGTDDALGNNAYEDDDDELYTRSLRGGRAFRRNIPVVVHA